MSNVTEFFSAEGISYLKPNLDVIIQAVSNGTQSDWEYGSGQAALYWQKDDLKKNFVLTPGGDDSYFVQLFSSDIPDWHHMSQNNKVKNGDKEVYVGGDPWLVPDNLFVYKHKVIEAIKDFYETGQASDHIDWVRSNQVQFTEAY